MRFAELAGRMETIEHTASRLEMGQRLADLLQEASEDETPRIAYLLLGTLAPEHEGLEIGLAEKMVIELVVKHTGASSGTIRERMAQLGDLGSVAESFWEDAPAVQTGLDAFQAAPAQQGFSVAEVHERLCQIARIQGQGSQETKVRHTLRLLNKASPIEARYIVRFLVGKLRLGVADMTLLDGAAIAYAPEDDVEIGDDDLPRAPTRWREALERAYNLTSDIGHVLLIARTEGLQALEAVHITPGKPVRPMLAERQTSAEEIVANVGLPALAEFKYDGLRTQAHLDGEETHLFSRRLEEVTAPYPDVVEALEEAFEGHAVVVEGEAVPVDPDSGRLRPFQEIAKRRGRKHGLEQAIEDVPIHTYLFDILYLDGEDLTVLPLEQRRAKLEAVLSPHDAVHISDAARIEAVEELEPFFEDAVARGAEGVMVKQLGEGAIYTAGARGWRWVKYKRDYREELADSLDLVIVGAYHGKGRRAGWYGTLLGAAYNPAQDRWETVCKIGTGFTDEDLAALNDVLDPHRVPTSSPDVEINDDLETEIYFEPVQVAEVRGAELTRSPVHTAARDERGGIALRFPRFIRWREDKGPRDATTVEEVRDLYERQQKVAQDG